MTLNNIQLLTRAQVRGLNIRAGEATVLDLNTNIAYNIFWGGAPNTHTDFSPLTPADTEIMRGISGGWNWNPRPVVLFIQGHQLAASVHHFPHGSIIGGNPGLPNAPNVGPFNQPNGGHMCMYFLDSVNNGQPRPSNHARQMQAKAARAFEMAQERIVSETADPDTHWAQVHHDNITRRGITIHETRFNDSITRGEVFAMLDRILTYLGR